MHPEHIAFTDQGPLIYLNDSETYPVFFLYFSPLGYFVQYQILNDTGQVFHKRAKTKGPYPACGVNTNWVGICINERCFFKGCKVL